MLKKWNKISKALTIAQLFGAAEKKPYSSTQVEYIGRRSRGE